MLALGNKGTSLLHITFKKIFYCKGLSRHNIKISQFYFYESGRLFATWG
jgi:hypothetical protein